MTTPREHRAAFTLVELLVVIAIITTLLAIAVPTMHRIGIFGRDELSASARDVLTKLKAARIYAGANRVDTAVVYSIGVRVDSDTSQPVPVIDGLALVRRITPLELDGLQELVRRQPNAQRRQELSDLLDLIRGPRDMGSYPYSVFLPLKDGEGVFETFPPSSVVMPALLVNVGDDLDLPFTWLTSTGASVNGLTPIRVVRLDVDAPNYEFTVEEIAPRTHPDFNLAYKPGQAPPGLPFSLNRFPAHIFRPTGVVVGEDIRARYVIEVGPSPDATFQERFIETDTGPEPVPPLPVELFPLTGRVQGRT